MKKRTMCLVLALSLIMSVMTLLQTVSYAESATGKCGDDLTYTFDGDTGVLTVSGSGAMTDYAVKNNSYNEKTAPPWYTWRDSIKEIVIEDGVTGIGKCAFFGCSEVTSVTVPASVEIVGVDAFYNCTSLAKVEISDLAKWCETEFKGINSNPVGYSHNLYLNGEPLTYLVIPDEVGKISNYAFYKCTSLTDLLIPDGVAGIGYRAFACCENIKSVVIPGSVETVDYMAFYNCKGLTVISFKNGIKNIGDEAFYECSGARTLTLPDSVEYLGKFSFAYCTGLESVVIGDGLGAIGDDAFCGCESLVKVAVGRGVTQVGSFSFSYCPALQYVYFNNALSEVGKGAFYKCENISDIFYAGSFDQWWNELNFGNENECLLQGELHCLEGLEDVDNDKWYVDGVFWCVENGLMTGTSNVTFSPDVVITRAMFATILAKIDHADLTDYPGTIQSSFSDVPSGKWFTGTIEWAYQTGYASGIGNGMFGPNNPVTRETLAQFLYNYSLKKGYDLEEGDDISGYPDADKVSGWAVDAVKWAIKIGLISGVKVDDEVYIQPRTNATRAQVALIIKNYAHIRAH